MYNRLRHKSAKEFYRLRGDLLHLMIHSLLHFRLLLRWVVLAVAVGLLLGVIGAAFVAAISFGTEYRKAHPWCLLLLLPALSAVSLMGIQAKDLSWTNEE